MKKSHISWAKRLLATPLAFLLLAVPLAQAQTTGPLPYLDNVQAVPSTFNPEVDVNTLFYFDLLDASANVSAYIISNGITYTVQNPTNTPIGTNHAIAWYGGLDSPRAPDGTYMYRIIAQGSYGSDEATGYVTVTSSGTTPPPTGVAPDIASLSVSDSPFDPDSETTTVSYSLNTQATVTVEIVDRSTNPDTVVRTFRDSQTISNGTDVHTWDGEDNSGFDVDEATYYVEVTATNTYGSDFDSEPIVVDYDGGGSSNDGVDITNHYTSPDDEFVLDDEGIRIYYEIDEEADITVIIYDDRDREVIELVDDEKAAGLWSVYWDGEDDDNDLVDEGEYTYEIVADNSDGHDEADGDFDAVEEGGGSNSDDLIDDVRVDRDWFDPDESERAKLTWDTLEDNVDITVEIIDDDRDLVLTLIDEREYDEGRDLWAYWNGRNRLNRDVSDGDYEFKITAEKGDHRQIEYEDIEVDTDGRRTDDDDEHEDDDYGELIDDIYVNPDIFDPSENETTRLYFDVLEDNVDVLVEILDNGRVISDYEREYDERDNATVTWDGEDDDGDEMSDDIYLFHIQAEKGRDEEHAYRWVELDTDGRIIGIPSGGNCGGFTDVPYGSPFCKAVELMSQRNIFDGYSDGTFRPHSPINRAEVTKVILLALDIPVLNDDGSNLGFWDVQRNSWYMPYLRTAQRLGIIHGYPDGSFRPADSPNRVELLKIFLETTGVHVPYCDFGPYADTPLNSDTRWYMDYVCFAATNGLMFPDASGRFYPDASMTRGDVANLFYQFERNGLYYQLNTDRYSDYYYTQDNYYNQGSYYNPGTYYTSNPSTYYYGDAYYRDSNYYTDTGYYNYPYNY
ncbi:S-layer homology domain-containing protein [Pseudomonadota bacterium]